MHRKDSLDADSVRHFPDRKGGAIGAPIDLDHDALEGLDALLLAFDDFDVNANPIADTEFGQVLAEPPLFELLDNGIHGKTDLGEPLNLPKCARALNTTRTMVPAAVMLHRQNENSPRCRARAHDLVSNTAAAIGPLAVRSWRERCALAGLV